MVVDLDPYQQVEPDLGAAQAVCIVAIVVSSLMALLVCLGVVYMIHRLRVYANTELSNMADSLPKALKCLRFASIPARVLALFCVHQGVLLTQVVDAYKKDSYERKAIIKRTFGQSNVVQRFIEKSKFMQTGYEGEDDLLKDKLE